jgi:ribosomal protein L40E
MFPVVNPSAHPAGCPFCEHINPSGSRFCNACGTPIDLVVCTRCGAANDPLGTQCHQCGAALPQGRLGALAIAPATLGAMDPAESEARTRNDGARPRAQLQQGIEGADVDAKLLATLHERAESRAAAIPELPTIRPRPGIALRGGRVMIVGATVFAIAAAAYYAYREHRTPDVLRGPASTGGRQDSGSSAAAANSVEPPGSAAGAMPGASTPAPATTVTAGDQPSAAIPAARSSGGTTVGVREPGAQAQDASAAVAPAPAAGGVARPRATEAKRGILERQAPHAGPCTEGVAALGLCTREANQRRE